MNLDDFVAETIKQIIAGVVTAQSYGLTHGAKVNPATARPTSGGSSLYCHESGIMIQNVSFDVALTISQENATSTPAGVTVGSISVSSTDTSAVQNSSISRVKFEMPVMFPTTGNNR